MRPLLVSIYFLPADATADLVLVFVFLIYVLAQRGLIILSSADITVNFGLLAMEEFLVRRGVAAVIITIVINRA
jgi:hypothetical protein